MLEICGSTNDSCGSARGKHFEGEVPIAGELDIAMCEKICNDNCNIVNVLNRDESQPPFELYEQKKKLSLPENGRKDTNGRVVDGEVRMSLECFNSLINSEGQNININDRNGDGESPIMKANSVASFDTVYDEEKDIVFNDISLPMPTVDENKEITPRISNDSTVQTYKVSNSISSQYQHSMSPYYSPRIKVDPPIRVSPYTQQKRF